MSTEKNGPIVADLVAVATEKVFIGRMKAAVDLKISNALALLDVCFSSDVAVTVDVDVFGSIATVWPAGAADVPVHSTLVAVDVVAAAAAAAAAAAIHAAVVVVEIVGIHAAAVIMFQLAPVVDADAVFGGEEILVAKGVEVAGGKKQAGHPLVADAGIAVVYGHLQMGHLQNLLKNFQLY